MEDDLDLADEERQPKWKPVFNALVTVAITIGGIVVVFVLLVGPLLLSEELGLDEEVALAVGMVAAAVLGFFFVKWSNARTLRIRTAHQAARQAAERQWHQEHQEKFDAWMTWAQSKLDDVHRVVLRTGSLSPGKESLYNKKLVRRVLAELAPGAVLNQPLTTGTRVDAWFEYSGMSWFITVKDQLPNQMRLLLQGEVEDILREAKPGIATWVVVVVLTEPEPHLNTISQLQRLRDHLADREKELDALMEKAITDEPTTNEAKEFYLRCLDIPLRDVRTPS